MARNIQYGVRSISNDQTAELFSTENVIFWLDCPPIVNPDRLAHITLDNFLRTDDVCDFSTDDAIARWNLLAPGKDFPDGINEKTALIYVEAIWLDTLVHGVKCHWYVLREFLLGSLDAHLGDWGNDFYADMRSDNVDLSWTTFEEIGEELAVDLKIDAWLSGVPLEYVIAE